MFFAPMIARLPQKPPLRSEISSAVRLGLYWSIPQTVSFPSPVTRESTAVFMWVSLCGMPHATFRLVTARVPPSTKNTARGNWRGGTFTMTVHLDYGRRTGATPDGRKAGFPFGDGSGPCQGREYNGPTASILSSTSWSHKEMIGGIAVNMKFSKKTFTQESCEKVAALINTYIDRGGFEIQVNVTDKDTLLAARENPEQFQDLVVRIGGYSDYFTRLSPQMQAEVILRTEHEI